MKIAVLAVQGAFIEHEKKLETLGAECFELRQKKDLDTRSLTVLCFRAARVQSRESFCGSLTCLMR